MEMDFGNAYRAIPAQACRGPTQGIRWLVVIFKVAVGGQFPLLSAVLVILLRM